MKGEQPCVLVETDMLIPIGVPAGSDLCPVEVVRELLDPPVQVGNPNVQVDRGPVLMDRPLIRTVRAPTLMGRGPRMGTVLNSVAAIWRRSCGPADAAVTAAAWGVRSFHCGIPASRARACSRGALRHRSVHSWLLPSPGWAYARAGPGGRPQSAGRPRSPVPVPGRRGGAR